MSVFVSIEDGEGENMEPVSRCPIRPRFRNPKGNDCLVSIDETEDAFFNQKQLPLLVKELSELAASDLKPAEREKWSGLPRLFPGRGPQPGLRAVLREE
jgi:hypothetical protein